MEAVEISVLDGHVSAGEEKAGLEHLLELNRGEDGSGAKSASRGRQWFPGGLTMSPAVAKTQPSSKVLRRMAGGRAGTSQRIQQSLAKLDDVLSDSAPTPTPTYPTPTYRTPTPASTHPPGSLFKGSLFHTLEATPTSHTHSTLLADATPTQHTGEATHPDSTLLSHTPQAQFSMMDTTGTLRDLVMAPTPLLEKTTYQASFLREPSKLLVEDSILGVCDSTVLEDLASKVGGDLIMAFHREFCSHFRQAQCLELTTALEKCCQVQWDILTDYRRKTNVSVSPMLSELHMEMATWQLVRVLCGDRVAEGAEEEAEMELLTSGRISDRDLVDDYFTKDSAIRQAQLVVDWLEQSARTDLKQLPVKVSYFADSVSWENTLHDITHGLGKGHIVTEMDPDAPTRQNLKLSELDSKDELALNKHIFRCIRAGQLEEALGLCVKCGQPLKAVMMEGWKLPHDPNVGKSMTDELEPMAGNDYRDVWKVSCWEMLQEPSYDAYEKAVFAALSGNIQKILPVCESWSDYVWAYFKTSIDVQVEKKLRSRVRDDSRELLALPSEYWNNALIPEVIFQEIESSSSSAIRERCQVNFHVVQKLIILDDLDGLVGVMSDWLTEKLTIHQLRFMAHICIIMRGLGRGDEDQINAVLEEYVKSLTASNYPSVVALYTSQLPKHTQVTRYAELLGVVQNEEVQKQCLELGKEVGLDVAMVTKVVVENVRDAGVVEAAESSPPELGKEVELTQLDRSKIEVIKWLMFEDSQRAEAIKQGNALIRQFLAARKHAAARGVHNKIPPDSVQLVKMDWQRKFGVSPLPSDVECDIRESLALQAYLESKEAFNEWFQHLHHHKPVPPSEPSRGALRQQVAYEQSLSQYEVDKEQWQSQTAYLTQEACNKLRNVLKFTGGWMVDDTTHGVDAAAADQGRVLQLQTLRKICIPETCFLLHSILHSKGQYKECLQLSDIVASDAHGLYKEFRKDELRKFLLLLHRSAMAVLDDQSTDELGYPI